MPVGVSIKARFEGPFFTRDPKKTFRQNIRDFDEALAREGEAAVRQEIAPRSKRVAERVRGRTSSLGGKRWQVSSVVSVDTSGLPRKEAIAIMAIASRIEGEIHVFRRVTSALRRQRNRLSEELLKGLE